MISQQRQQKKNSNMITIIKTSNSFHFFKFTHFVEKILILALEILHNTYLTYIFVRENT